MSTQSQKPISLGKFLALGVCGFLALGMMLNAATNTTSPTATTPVVATAPAHEQPLPTPQQVDRFQARVQQLGDHFNSLTIFQQGRILGNHDINVKARECWNSLTSTTAQSNNFCVSLAVVAHCVEFGDTETNVDVLDFCRWIKATT